MNKIDWTNHYGKMERKELYEELAKYTKRGFKYVPYNPVSLESSRVITPWGIGMTELAIEKLLSGKLIFGNRIQAEAIDAIELFKIMKAIQGLV